MGDYTRADSPFFWLALERPGRKPIRESSGVPVDGGTSQQTRHNRRLAQEAYAARMGALARRRFEFPGRRIGGCVLHFCVASPLVGRSASEGLRG